MFRIISDLGADIPMELQSETLTLINQSVTIDGQEKIYDLQSPEQMHQCFADIQNATTYATRAMTYQELFDTINNFAQIGGDILCFSFSQRLSGTGRQMQKVCQDLDGKYGKVVYYDTQTATVGQGVLVYYALQAQRAGKSIEQTVELLDKIKDNLHFYILLDKNNHFFKGGRCDGMSAQRQGYPMLYLPLGQLYHQVAEFFSRESGLAFVEKKLQANKNAVIFVGHGNNVELAKSLAERWQKYGKTATCYANPVMGVHTGKDPILVAYLQDGDAICDL